MSRAIEVSGECRRVLESDRPESGAPGPLAHDASKLSTVNDMRVALARALEGVGPRVRRVAVQQLLTGWLDLTAADSDEEDVVLRLMACL